MGFTHFGQNNVFVVGEKNKCIDSIIWTLILGASYGKLKKRQCKLMLVVRKLYSAGKKEENVCSKIQFGSNGKDFEDEMEGKEVVWRNMKALGKWIIRKLTLNHTKHSEKGKIKSEIAWGGKRMCICVRERYIER